MRIERASGKEERRILIGMIVDSLVCGKIATKWQSDLFRSKWANIVGELCVRFHEAHGSAPGKSIEGLFESWATKKRQDKDTVALVEKFLGSLSDEYESLASESNPSYTIDLAGKHFTKVRLQRVHELIGADIDTNDLAQAIERINDFAPVDVSTSAGVDVLHDRAALEKAFAERKEPLIKLPGALGRFFGHSLVREAFVSFLAPEKRGKTWWLCEIAWRAMIQRKRVAFFSVGDESTEDIMIRFAMRATRHPRFPETVRIPISITIEKGERGPEPFVEHEERKFERELTYQRACKAFDTTLQKFVKSKKTYLRLSVHPNSSLNVKGIDAQLKAWEREGWVPDILVVDYMDILLESGSGSDARHKINQTWKDMRGLTQKWHVLGITATQADADAYSAHTLGLGNFSEDKRKFAHVTGMVGINQIDTEKDMGVQRLNWIVRRGAHFDARSLVFCAGSLAIGCPCIRTA